MAKEENIILPVFAGLGILLLFSGGDKEPPKYAPPPGSLVTPTDFIKKYWDEALFSQQATGIPALTTMTQAGLESGWGRSAPKYNFFGVKDSSKWSGAVQDLLTWECGPTGNPVKDRITDTIIKIYPPGSSQGVCGPEDPAAYGWLISGIGAGSLYSYRVRAKFRAYPSARAAFIDHGKFFLENPRYKSALQYRNDNIKFAKAIAAAGYATDPRYADKLIDAMKIVVTVLQRNRMI